MFFSQTFQASIRGCRVYTVFVNVSYVVNIANVNVELSAPRNCDVMLASLYTLHKLTMYIRPLGKYLVTSSIFHVEKTTRIRRGTALFTHLITDTTAAKRLL